MKTIITLLLALVSFSGLAQTGSVNATAIRSKVTDSTTVQTPTGYGIMYFNVASGKWRVWNGAVWSDLGTGAGGGGGGGTISGLTTSYIPKASSSTSLSNSIIYESSSKIGIGTTSLGGNTLTVNGQLAAAGRIWTGGAYNYHTNATGGYYVSGDASTAIGMYEASSSLLFKTGSTDRVSITSSGLVGINNTSPTVNLEVRGTYATPGDNNGFFKIKGGTGSHSQLQLGLSALGGYAWIQNTQIGSSNDRHISLAPLGGNVGINNTSPNVKLEVSGSYATAADNSGIFKINGGSGAESQLQFGISALGGYAWIQNTQIGSSSDRNIVMAPLGGKIGIATTSPAQTLDVNGTLAVRSGSPGANKVLISDADGDASWSNTTGITGVGTISSGTWQGTAVADSYISSASTWNAKIGGSGSTNQLAYFTGSGTVGGSSSFTVNTGTNTLSASNITASGTVTGLNLVGTALTSGSVPTVTTGGQLISDNGLTWTGASDILRVGSTSNSILMYGLAGTISATQDGSSLIVKGGDGVGATPGGSMAVQGGPGEVAGNGDGGDATVYGGYGTGSGVDGDVIISGRNITMADVGSGGTAIDVVNISIDADVVSVKGMTIRSGSASLDFPNTLAGATSSLTITVTGVATGDPVFFGQPYSSGYLTARCSAANTVTVTFHNDSGVSVDLASGTYKVVTYSF